MDIRNRRAIHQTASDALAGAPGTPQNVALAYAGICSGLSLVVAVISYLLTDQISNTGGLSNMGLRSILSTGQSVLPLAQMLILTGLGMGYHISVLKMARRQESTPRTLLEGFRIYFPLLRTLLLEMLIYLGIAIGCGYLSSFLFLMLPVSAPFYEIMESLMGSVSSLDGTLVVDDATLAAATSAMAPMMVIFVVLFCVVAAPIYYQYRMSSYCLADNPKRGALAALRNSRNMMRRNRFALFRLDLDFWWFYLLQALVAVICYLDILLPMAGVSFPWSNTVSYFLFYGLSLLAQIALYYFALNRVNVTYATAYEALRPHPQERNYPVIQL